jgi:hypothetical protein
MCRNGTTVHKTDSRTKPRRNTHGLSKFHKVISNAPVVKRDHATSTDNSVIRELIPN